MCVLAIYVSFLRKFCQAVKDGNTEEVEKWLKYDKKMVRVQDKHGYAPVHYAVKFNRLEILQMLHKDGKAGKIYLACSHTFHPQEFEISWNFCCYSQIHKYI